MQDRLDPGEDRFRELADFAPVMIWRAGPDKLCDWFNRPWLVFRGRSMQEELGFGWAEGVHPDDYERCVVVYTSAFDRREAFSMEYRLQRHDGIYRWLLDNGSPFTRGPEQTFAGYFGSCIDITAQKDLQRAQQVLIDELDHRVKNTLATVQSLARQSFARGLDEAALHSFNDRVAALARTHDALTAAAWQGADLADLARSSVQPHVVPEDVRLTIDGPPLRLLPRAASILAMAFQELAMNAVRHGALAAAAGHVRLAWRIEGAELRLEWREAGGPPVAEPDRSGFGRRLLAGPLANQLSGQVTLEFAPGGAVCSVVAPLESVAA